MKLFASKTRGLFSRGTADQCPPNFLLTSFNLMSRGPNISLRPGLQKVVSIATGITKLAIFKPTPVSGVVSEKIIYQRVDAKVFNFTDFPGASIYNGVKNFFSWVNFFGHGYFGCHDTIIGSSTEKVQVYEGGAASRDACGTKPVSAMAGALAGGGNLAVGDYLIDVCYVTSSGFITQPSGSVLRFTSTGGFVINLNTIPTSGTFQRYIIASKAIPIGSYTGNPRDYEFFFVPNGLLNSTDTTFTVNFFDGELISSADYLFDLLSSIPAGVHIGNINGRLASCGEAANPSMIRISKAGDPESISATSGFIIVDPSESEGLKNFITLRGNTYLFKSYRTYVTTDNGGDPSTWPIDLFDAGVGAETNSISEVLDSNGNTLNQFLIGSRSGLILFDGVMRYPELTYWIEDIWRGIDPALFPQMEVKMDPVHKHIYCTIPNNVGIFTTLFGDYSNGLDSDNIKWFFWQMTSIGASTFNTVIIQVIGGVVTISFGLNQLLYNFQPDSPRGFDQDSSGVDTEFLASLQTGPLIFDAQPDNVQQIETVWIRHISVGQGIRVRAQSVLDFTKQSSSTFLPSALIGNMQDKWIYLPWVDDCPSIFLTLLSSHLPKISQMAITGQFYGDSGPQ